MSKSVQDRMRNLVAAGIKLATPIEACTHLDMSVDAKITVEKLLLFENWYTAMAEGGVVLGCAEYNALLGILNAARREPEPSRRLEKAVEKYHAILQEDMRKAIANSKHIRNSWESKTDPHNWKRARQIERVRGT